jgi:hypothetical protein
LKFYILELSAFKMPPIKELIDTVTSEKQGNTFAKPKAATRKTPSPPPVSNEIPYYEGREYLPGGYRPGKRYGLQ